FAAPRSQIEFARRLDRRYLRRRRLLPSQNPRHRQTRVSAPAPLRIVLLQLHPSRRPHRCLRFAILFSSSASAISRMRDESRQGRSSCPQDDGASAPSRCQFRAITNARRQLTARGRAVSIYQRVEDNAFHYTRERRRPELRVYFIGRRLGSIFARPVPLFTSIIWSRNSAARSNSRFAEASCISCSSSRSSSERLKSPPVSRITDDSTSRPRRIVCRLSWTARRTVCGVMPCVSLYSICLA